MLLMSCDIPNLKIEVSPLVEETTTETEPEEEIEDETETTIEPVTETITEPEIIEEEKTEMKRTFTMNAIPNALGYIFTSGYLKGITAETGRTDFLLITPNADISGTLTTMTINDFFMKEGSIYFSLTDRYMEDEELIEKELFFKQTEGMVSIISKLPSEPVSEKLAGDFGIFSFLDYVWEEETYTKLFIPGRREPEEIVSVAKMFDSAVLTNMGLMFSQPETLSRKSGLWFVRTDTPGAVPTKISEYVRIWN